MKSRRVMMSTFCAMALLGGCSFDVANDNHWLIKPTMRADQLLENPQVWYDLGRYYQGQERHQEAVWALEKALVVNGNAVEARNRLGASLAALGRYDQAIREFEKALDAAPQAAHIHSNLGYALLLAGHPAQAVASLERSVSLDPSNQRALNNLDMAYSQMGDNDRARGAFAAASGEKDQAAPAPLPERNEQQEAVPALAQEQEESRAQVQVVKLASNVYELQLGESVPVKTAKAVATTRTRDLTARLEVSNGNGVTGMARLVGSYLKGNGFATSRLTNQSTFTVPSSRVEYREGFEAEAKRVAAALPGEVAVAESNALRRDIGLRLVLGRDLVGSVAYFEPRGEAVRIAQNIPR